MNKVKERLKKIWAKITESKLNVSIFAASVTAVVLIAAIAIVIILRDGQVTNEYVVTVTEDDETTLTASETGSTGDEENETTEEEQYSTKIDEDATTNVVSYASRLSAYISIEDSWTYDGEYYIQYCIDVTNVSDTDIDGWALVLDLARSYTLVDSWNFAFKEGTRKLIINPLNENREIESGDTVTGGFIIKSTSYVYVNYITVYVGDDIETIKNANTYIPATTTAADTEEDSDTESDTTTKITESTTASSSESSETDSGEETELTTDASDSETTTVYEETTTSDDTSESSGTEIITSGETSTSEINTTLQNEINTTDSSTTVPITQ